MHPLNPAGLVSVSAQNGGDIKNFLERSFLFKAHALHPPHFGGEKGGFGCCTHLTRSLQPLGIKGVLESEFWDVVDERCVGRAFREPGQQGVEEQLPPLAIVHPDAEEIPPALHLVPVGAASGMAKIPLLGERKSQVEVCVLLLLHQFKPSTFPGAPGRGPCVGSELGGCVGSDQPLEVEEQSSWTHAGRSAGLTLSLGFPHAPLVGIVCCCFS